MATVTFASPIYNGEGPDFAVFENGFDIDDEYDPTGVLHFLELAFVEVSSDGENFFRFPAVTNVPSTARKGSKSVPANIPFMKFFTSFTPSAINLISPFL